MTKSPTTLGDQEKLPAQSGSVNINQRRTRRGVYAILPDDEDASDADVEPDLEPDATSELASAPRSSPPARSRRALKAHWYPYT